MTADEARNKTFENLEQNSSILKLQLKLIEDAIQQGKLETSAIRQEAYHESMHAEIQAIRSYLRSKGYVYDRDETTRRDFIYW